MLLDFKKLMTARFLFTLGTQVQAVVLGWQMYVLTKDPLYLGLVGLVEAIPALGLALYAGYLVDRSRPLFVLRRVIDLSLLSTVVLLVTQLPMFGFAVSTQIGGLFAASFLTGTARSFSQPSMFALVPRLLPRDQLQRASAWMTTAMQIARISGPALGGVLYGAIGIAGAAGFSVAFLFGAMLAAALIKTSPPALPPSTAHASRLAELFSGLKFVFKHPLLLPALSLDMISVLFGGVTALLPIYAAEILFIGPMGLGALRAAPAFGAALTSTYMARRPVSRRAGPTLFGVVFGFGLMMLVFSMSKSFALSFVALFASGAFDSVSMVIRTAAVQLSSPDAMRGKISAVNSIFIGSSNELGEFESGVLARFMGTVPSAIFGSVMCLLTVLATAVFCPTLRRLDLEELQGRKA